MNEKHSIEYYEEELNNNPALAESVLTNCDFSFDDTIDVEKDILNCGEKSNYTIHPFGKAGDGSSYVLLDNGYIAYISSDGECGIVAKDVDEFFNIMLACKALPHYFRKGVFDSIDSFEEKYDEVNKHTENPEAIKTFIESQNLETDVEKLYKMFLAGLTTEPSLELQANPEEYAPWDDVFGTNQEYIKELRNKMQ